MFQLLEKLACYTKKHQGILEVSTTSVQLGDCSVHVSLAFWAVERKRAVLPLSYCPSHCFSVYKRTHNANWWDPIEKHTTLQNSDLRGKKHTQKKSNKDLYFQVLNRFTKHKKKKKNINKEKNASSDHKISTCAYQGKDCKQSFEAKKKRKRKKGGATQIQGNAVGKGFLGGWELEGVVGIYSFSFLRFIVVVYSGCPPTSQGVCKSRLIEVGAGLLLRGVQMHKKQNSSLTKTQKSYSPRRTWSQRGGWGGGGVVSSISPLLSHCRPLSCEPTQGFPPQKKTKQTNKKSVNHHMITVLSTIS